MCGLVGVFSGGTLSKLEKEIFMDLLQADIIRGPHSFGVIGVNRNQASSYYKVAGPQPYAWYSKTKEFADFINADGLALIGHNRFATKGAINSTNAHPFRHGHITMVHNGTLTENIGKFEVDSDWLCNKLSTEKDIPSFLGELWGAYALIWYDDKEKTINIARNNERPLAIAKEGNTYYLASEAKMLEWILAHNKKSTVKVSEVQSGKIYSYSLTSGLPVKEVAIPAKKWSHSTSYGGYGGADYDYGYTRRHNNEYSDVRKAKVIVEVTDWWENLFGTTYDPTTRSQRPDYLVSGVVQAVINKGNGRKYHKLMGQTILFSGVSARKLEDMIEANGADKALMTVEVYDTMTTWHVGDTQDRKCVALSVHNTSPVLANKTSVSGLHGVSHSFQSVKDEEWGNADWVGETEEQEGEDDAKVLQDALDALDSANKEPLVVLTAPNSNVIALPPAKVTPKRGEKTEPGYIAVLCDCCGNEILAGALSIRNRDIVCSKCRRVGDN